MTEKPDEYQPSRHDRLRPAEYVGGAAIAAIFVGLVALMSTRDIVLSSIGAGGTFIIVLMVLALLQMAIKPDAEEDAEIHEADEDGTARRAADEGRSGH